MAAVRDRSTTLKVALGLTCVVLLVELLGGLAAHSLALLSDAGHVLTDVFALGLAWFAVAQAKRPADQRRSYGYHRVSILAALVNAVTLIVIVIVIAVEAVRRLANPEPVQGGLVIVAALVGIAINAFVVFGLRGDTHNLNMRAAVLHVTGDIGASIGVAVAGAIILFTGWLAIDPLLSIAIAVLIAFGAWRIVRETVNLLMEGTPREINLAAVTSEITGTRSSAACTTSTSGPSRPTRWRSAFTWWSTIARSARPSTWCETWKDGCAIGSPSDTRRSRSRAATHAVR